MKSVKRGIAMLLAMLLVVPTVPTGAAETNNVIQTPETEEAETENIIQTPETPEIPETETSEIPETEEGIALLSEKMPEFGDNAVYFSTGAEYQLVVNESVSGNEEYAGYTGVFGEDGNYTIQIPEEDPFFPYEVQFVNQSQGNVENLWFMTPDSIVEFGGHSFRVEANFTGQVVTQMSLNIAGDTVTVYPAEKEFGGAAPMSLLPLEEKNLGTIDMTGYTPLEMTMVSVDSIFTGENALTDTDSIVWKIGYSGKNDYTISQKGAFINMSYATSFEMIVGEPDQLAADNIRYRVSINRSDSTGWLSSVIYGQAEDGTRTGLDVLDEDYYTYSDYGRESLELSSRQGYYREGYLALTIHAEAYAKTKFRTVRAYEGSYMSATEAMAATDVTEQIFCPDMTQNGAGYRMNASYGYDVTLVSFDEAGNVTGCLPLKLVYHNAYSGLSSSYIKDLNGDTAASSCSYSYDGNCRYYTYKLYSGYPADGVYFQKFDYEVDGETDTSAVTAYLGLYSTIAEARENNAEDVKEALFGTGYSGNYAEGIFFTIFVGEDGAENQQVYQYNIKVEEGNVSKENNDPAIGALNRGTAVSFSSLYGENRRYISSLKLQGDSYAEGNFIVYLVDEEVDRSRLAPGFYISYDSLKLYAEGSAEPVVSGESYFDFSNGPVQFTASSEDKQHSMNYWVQVISKSDVSGQIFMNSLIDPDAETETRDGVVYTTREVMLDGLHDYRHDIMLANMGEDAIENLSAELTSDVLELDDYWTLKGNHELSGFTNTDRTTSYGKLSNLAMLRLRKRQEAPDGSDVTGTLTIKSGNTVLMVINLTGTVSDPVITTEEIPAAVKYVPYGTMIQNSNKYSWNEPSYQMLSGALPEGMEIMPNGELYGVPRETGEFTFTVQMRSSYSSFKSSAKEFTLVVLENTDENVDGETSEGYDLTKRVSYNYNESLGDQMMTSQGEFGEFVDLWLDGVKLERGVDYEAESGSTRITIYAQTLAGGREDGTHTLGVEFRDSAEELKRAAQNYVLGSDTVPDNNPSDNGTSGGTDSGDNGGTSGGNSAVSGGSGAGSEPSIVYHTVARGENLWKISVKYFGNGNRWRQIYEDNRNILRSPNRLYVGQVLVIYINAESVSGRTVSANAAGILVGNTYTVRPGDSLWKIAALVYENGLKWKKIYEANLDRISDASRIRIGQTLVIPE